MDKMDYVWICLSRNGDNCIAYESPLAFEQSFIEELQDGIISFEKKYTHDDEVVYTFTKHNEKIYEDAIEKGGIISGTKEDWADVIWTELLIRYDVRREGNE